MPPTDPTRPPASSSIPSSLARAFASADAGLPPEPLSLKQLSKGAREIVERAQGLADQLHHATTTPLHVLAKLLELETIARAAREQNGDPTAAAAHCREALSHLPTSSEGRVHRREAARYSDARAGLVDDAGRPLRAAARRRAGDGVRRDAIVAAAFPPPIAKNALQTWAEQRLGEVGATYRGLQELVDAWAFLQGKASLLFGMTTARESLSHPDALADRVREALRARYSTDGLDRQSVWDALAALGLTEGLTAPVLEPPKPRVDALSPRVYAPAGTVPGPYRAIAPEMEALTVQEIWLRVERWLADHHPKLLELLAPPATEEELEALEAALGVTLPGDYRASLRIHAGGIRRPRADGSEYDVSPFGFLWLLPPKSVIEKRAWLHEYASFDPPGVGARVVGAIQRVFYHPGWLPIAGADQDDCVIHCLDTVPTVDAAYGQILYFSTKDDEREACYRGFRDFLATELPLPLETGAIDEEETRECGFIVLA